MRSSSKRKANSPIGKVDRLEIVGDASPPVRSITSKVFRKITPVVSEVCDASPAEENRLQERGAE